MKRAGSGAYTNGVAGETFADRDLAYLNAGGLWVKANANSVANMPVVGMVMGATASGQRVSVLLRGFIGSGSWTWTAGAPLYPTAVAGIISQTPPILGVRQTVGYAVNNTLIYFDRGSIENVIYWSSINRTTYGIIANTTRTETLVNGAWWVLDATPSETTLDNFSGVFDITGLGIACAISHYPYYVTKTGAGALTTNSGPNSGMKITTGAVPNDDMLMANGDNTGPKYMWNPLNEVWMHIHYRFPAVGDTANVYYLLGLYQNANNYVGIRYDTAVDTNLRLVTRSLGAETVTSLGAVDTDWHVIYTKFSAGEVVFTDDTGITVYIHTLDVPTGNFTWFSYLKTLNNVAKHVDLAHMTLVQTII